MDIKRMHDMIEKLTECTKSQFDKGLESEIGRAHV